MDIIIRPRLDLSDEQVDAIEEYIPLAKRKDFRDRVCDDRVQALRESHYAEDIRAAQKPPILPATLKIISGLTFTAMAILYGFDTMIDDPHHHILVMDGVFIMAMSALVLIYGLSGMASKAIIAQRIKRIDAYFGLFQRNYRRGLEKPLKG